METCKNLILPTDFTVKSLNLVRETLELFPDTSVNLWLVHGVHLPLSISDLLFYSKGRHLQKLQEAEFQAACRMIQNKYQSRLESLNVDLVNSVTPAYLKAYTEARQITDVLIPKYYRFKMVESKSFDLVPLFKSLPLRKTELNWKDMQSQGSASGNAVSDLFGTGNLNVQLG